MKAARIIAKNQKKPKLHAGDNAISFSLIKQKLSAKKSSSTKISAQTQFTRIKEALQEAELIEAGKIQPTSLKEALDGL